MDDINIVSIVYLCIVFGLIALFVVSLTLFIRRFLVNSSIKNNQLNKIEKKLDKIIELLEKDRNS
ncbi:DUF4083 domain-containing protein [Brevibacillus sp. B_LB10_24]|uniref:DUF4083 domain-containing protein n=1 Tax=Brevibacillus sp. B_LB10_24 TaxID=3380645 RepID=UPI0038BB6786